MSTKITFRGQIAPIMSGIRTGGDGLRLTLDIPESDVQDAVALIALRNCPLKVTIELDNSPAATRIERPADPSGINPDRVIAHEPQLKGEHSRYWQKMFASGFQNYPDLIQVLGCAGPGTKQRLYDIFQVETLANVSPAEFEDFCASEGLHSIITLSRQAQAKLREAA